MKFKNVTKQWLEKKELEVKETTLERYDAIVKNHLNPVFGEKKIENIKEKHLIVFVKTFLLKH